MRNLNNVRGLGAVRTLNRVRFIGRGAPFDPLDLNPFLYLESDTGLRTGDDPAPFLGSVSRFLNPGTASDATQDTGASQPLALTGSGYLFLPGITGNTASVPLAAETYDYTVTYVGGTTATGTIVSDGTVTFGPTGTDFERKQIRRIVLELSGVTALDIDFSKAAHKATSFTADTGQTVTVNRSGLNPAAIIGRPVVRTDGVDDFLSGTFAEAINGGRMFAVFEVLGTGGAVTARVFTISPASGSVTDTSGAMFTLNGSGVLRSYYESSGRLSITSGFSGRILHEVGLKSGENFARRNNEDHISDTIEHSIASTRFGVAGQPGGGTAYPAIDLEHLSLFPADMSEADAAKQRNLLNEKYNLGLTL